MVRKLVILIAASMLIWAPACRKSILPDTIECNVPNDTSALHPKGAQFQAILDKYTQNGLPGIALLVRDGQGRWLGSSGMADLGAGTPMMPCHVSKIASVSKLFTGIVVMQLVEEGVLNLDAPISTWVPEPYISDIKNARETTLRMLLNHSSGIADVIKDNAFYLQVLNNPNRHWTEEELLDFVLGEEPLFSPAGDSVDYSNTNLLLAAYIIEKATGEGHEKLIHRYIIDPLALNNSFYAPFDALPDNTAHGYYDLYQNNTLFDMSSFNTGSGNGYTGMYSNVLDMQRFIEALLRDKTLLSAAALQEMMTVRAFDAGEGEYYGVTLRKEFFGDQKQWIGYGHRGRDLAYTADLFYFPDQDITVAWVLNYGTDGKSDLKDVFLDFRKEMIAGILE